MNPFGSRNTPVQFPSTWASIHFDLLRGLAAFFVLFEHWRNLFFVDFSLIVAHRLPLAVFYILASAGHQSVVLFFVLVVTLSEEQSFALLSATNGSGAGISCVASFAFGLF
jgi:hypothetical protein